METISNTEVDVDKIIEASANQVESGKQILEAVQIMRIAMQFPDDKHNAERMKKFVSQFTKSK